VAAVSDRTQNRGRQSGATAGLKEKLSSARKLVHVLDAFVETEPEDDEALLANWNMIKRVRRVGPKAKPPAAEVTPVAAAGGESGR
jgi:hypothetical protein